ncbi:Fic family protein [Paenirhodobacter populi]|uniref:Fic family protein n=1 Tax=Paenirhodobacter populi TaxID=2306993 RepID=UPI0019D4CCAF|nr:Fic family protein [Sinirhodobacter populi]
MVELGRENWLAGLSAERFAERMAWLMGELNVPHPFRDGNGRALREYVRYLAERADYPITWEDVPPDAMLAVSIAAYRGDTTLLPALLLRQIGAADHDEQAAPLALPCAILRDRHAAMKNGEFRQHPQGLCRRPKAFHGGYRRKGLDALMPDPQAVGLDITACASGLKSAGSRKNTVSTIERCPSALARATRREG